MNAKVISLLNEKGGVAKTTTATAIAYILAKRGKKTVVLDFDGQGHSSLLCGVQNVNSLPVTIATLLNKVIMDEPLPAPESYIINNNGVDLIPSNSQLFTLERNLCNVDFRERILKTYVDTIRERYEYIIIKKPLFVKPHKTFYATKPAGSKKNCKALLTRRMICQRKRKCC